MYIHIIIHIVRSVRRAVSPRLRLATRCRLRSRTPPRSHPGRRGPLFICINIFVCMTHTGNAPGAHGASHRRTTNCVKKMVTTSLTSAVYAARSALEHRSICSRGLANPILHYHRDLHAPQIISLHINPYLALFAKTFDT